MGHRVLIVHNRYLQRGGEDAAVSAEAELLRSAGLSVREALTANCDLNLANPLSRWSTGLACTWSPGHYNSLRSEIRRFKPTIVHCHNLFPVPSPAAYYAARAEGVRVIQTLHNYRLMCMNATFIRDGKPCFDCLRRAPVAGIVHRCYRDSSLGSVAVGLQIMAHRAMRTWDRAVDRYVALTDVSRSLFIKGGLPAERIDVKPNFLDPDPGGGEHHEQYVLFVGRLSIDKGIDVLLKAWGAFSDKIELRIIGEGPLEAAVREHVRADSRVRFLGSLPRELVLKQMKAARLLVLPSRWNEGLPLVVLEAMAVGLPILCSDAENLEDTIVNQGAGWSFPTGSPDGLLGAISKTWNEDRALKEKGDMARQRYLSRYTAGTNLRTLLAIYDGLEPGVPSRSNQGAA